MLELGAPRCYPTSDLGKLAVTKYGAHTAYVSSLVKGYKFPSSGTVSKPPVFGFLIAADSNMAEYAHEFFEPRDPTLFWLQWWPNKHEILLIKRCRFVNLTPWSPDTSSGWTTSQGLPSDECLALEYHIDCEPLPF